MNTKTAIAAFALAAGATVLSAPLAGAGQFQTMWIQGNQTVQYTETGGRNGVEAGKEVNLVIAKDICPVADKGDKRVRSTLFSSSGLVERNASFFTRVLLKKAKPGSYKLEVECRPNGFVPVRFEVLAAKPQPTTSPRPTTSPTKPKPTATTTAAVPVKPKGAPETGGGATAEHNPTGYLAGGAALAAGLGLGVWGLRRRATQS